MYRSEDKKKGSLTTTRLFKPKTGNSLCICAEKGATLVDLKLAHTEIYDGYNTEEELKNLSWGKGILLAPFPNRLNDGKYTFQGNQYQFPINDADGGNAIHGFISQMPFEIKEIHTAASTAHILLTYTYAGDLDYYPFPFHAEVKYSLSDKEGLSVHFTITNKHKSSIPIGLGWHPYFKLSEQVNDTYIQLPPLQMVEINKKMIPTGNLLPFTAFRNNAKIEDFILDNCFYIDSNEEQAEVTLQSDLGKLTYRQPTNREGCPYIQIFQPPHRKNIALEPMTCNIDAFNNGEGLRILQAEEKIELSCQLSFEKKV